MVAHGRLGTLILGADPAIIAALSEACAGLRHRGHTESTRRALAFLEAARPQGLRLKLGDGDPPALSTLKRYAADLR